MRKTLILTTGFIILSAFTVYHVLSQPVYAANATLSLSPSTQSVNNGDTFTVQVLLNTGGANTSGTDVALSFDKDKLDLLEITNGTIYDQYIGKTINNDSGTALLSGLASSSTTLYKGSGTFATLKFRAVTNGTASVTFNFTLGNKNDSNVADFDTQTDALTSVVNGTYTISGTTSGGGGGSTPTSTPIPPANNPVGGTTKPTKLPVTADMYPFFLLGAISVLLVTSGLFLMRYFKKN